MVDTIEKMTEKYTKKQGQYLSFIYYYTKIHRIAPAHIDLQKYFNSDPASVNSMLKTLERKGFISRVPGKARSIELLLTRDQLPDLE